MWCWIGKRLGHDEGGGSHGVKTAIEAFNMHPKTARNVGGAVNSMNCDGDMDCIAVAGETG